ncbi:MAG: hypothetical protein ACJ789_19730 [Thermomicrobiales bacterium]
MDESTLLVMYDLVDEQLRGPDGRNVARVAGLEATWKEDGSLVLKDLVVGPEELISRVWRRLRPLAHALLRGRFEHRIPLGEVAKIELDIHLREDPARYGVGEADRWVVDHILRFIPGNGRQ